MQLESAFWAQTLANPQVLFLFQLCLSFTLPQGDLIDWKKPASLCIFLLSYFQLFYVKLWQRSPLTPYALFFPMAFSQGLKLALRSLASPELSAFCIFWNSPDSTRRLILS